MARAAFVGNFSPEHSTENLVREGLEEIGVEVELIQEDEADWNALASRDWLSDGIDAFLWTRTLSLDAHAPRDLQLVTLANCARQNVPTIALHLDRYWGLPRATEIGNHPWWLCSRVWSADGGNDERWRQRGVEHRWLRPAAPAKYAYDGTPRPEWECDVLFVGSWRSYHPEWPWRRRMVEVLRDEFGPRFRAVPQPADERQPIGETIRGAALNDLIASASVVVGDYLNVGADGTPFGGSRYYSDRLPESLIRGALLVHPFVEGCDDYEPRIHFVPYPHGDLAELLHVVHASLAAWPERQDAMRLAGRERVLGSHTWAIRMREVLAESGILVGETVA